MVKGKKETKKSKGADFHSQHSHLFKSTPRTFRIGQDLPPKRDLYRFVKWPRYIRIQRQRAILKKRLKVPPAVAQFGKTLQGNQAKDLFKLLKNYMPESPEDKTKRLKARAEAELKEEKQKKQEKKSKKRKKRKTKINQQTKKSRSQSRKRGKTKIKETSCFTLWYQNNFNTRALCESETGRNCT